MQRYFNTEGQCQPDIHYMVRLDERLAKIKQLYVDKWHRKLLYGSADKRCKAH